MADIPAITRFLRGFWPRISPAEWQRLFDYDWIADKPDIGFVLTDSDGAIGGFLATIYADREIAGRRTRFCNVSSWAVLPEHRACAMMLVREVLGRRDCTITNLSPSPEAQAFFLRLGFEPLEDAKLAWLPFANIRDAAPPHARAFRGRCRAHEGDAGRPWPANLDDHPRCRHLVFEQGGACSHLVRIVRVKRGIRVSEILYCSDSALLARVFEQLKLHVMRRDRTALLAADARLLGANAPRALKLPRNACFSARAGLRGGHRQPVFGIRAAADVSAQEFV